MTDLNKKLTRSTLKKLEQLAEIIGERTFVFDLEEITKYRYKRNRPRQAKLQSKDEEN